MPESVTDRPTSSHEYLFLLTRSGEPTYWTHRDLDGVRSRPAPDHRWIDPETGAETAEEPAAAWRSERMPNDRRRWTRVNLWRGHDYFYDGEAVREPSVAGHCSGQGVRNGNRQPQGRSGFGTGVPWEEQAGRSLRSVWQIATQPYPEAHFATFPEELARRCIAAGTSGRGCCPKCGAPWERVVEKQRLLDGEMPVSGAFSRPDEPFRAPSNGVGHWRYSTRTTEHGWRSTCRCEAGEPVPCTVLDPFAGSGTTLAVARRMGRCAVGIDLRMRTCR